MTKLSKGDYTLEPSELDAVTGAALELTQAQLNRTPLSDHSGEKLDVAAGSPPEDDEAVPCSQAGDLFGYQDLHDGSPVTISDGGDKTLGVTELQGGRITVRGTVWDFVVDIPKAEFYSVAVAQRGSVQINGGEAADSPIALELG